jgi:hypothetical protein
MATPATDPDDAFFDMLHAAEEAEPDPAAAVRAQCDQWAQAAMQLRFAPDRWPSAHASPTDVKNALVDVRGLLDQLEGLLANIVSFKGATAAQARDLEQQADDAWDEQAEAERRRPRPEYQGSKERYAYWNLAIREQRARARQAREMADYARTTYDVVRLVYDGLNETRRDLASRLTHFRWESHIEQ